MATIEPRRAVLPGGEEIIVRTGVGDDAPGVLAHRVHVAHTSEHNVTRPEEIDDTLDDQRKWLNDRLDRPYELFVVGVSDAHPGLVIGSIHFHSYNRQVLAHHGDFGISVDEAWRGRGVGSVLIRTLLDWAREHPTIEKVCLGVYETNEKAIRLYERMGFRLEGRREKYFKTGPASYVDDLMMSLWVKPPGK
jgi:RimJ/RimL family protein N-acetyltransferase